MVSPRMSIDYRDLNNLTIKNRYSLPRIDDLFDQLQGSQYFSKIDLRSGYHQLRVHEDDIHRSAFYNLVMNIRVHCNALWLTNAPSIVEQEVKGTASSSSSSQNMTFMSSPSSTNEVNTAYGVSTKHSSYSPASTSSYTASTPNDIEEMDLKWQLALLSMRTRRWSVSTATRWDTLQGNTEDLGTKIAETESDTPEGLYMADEEVPTNMALMAFSDSEFNKSEFNLATYKRGLASVEEQLVFYKKNESIKSRRIGVNFMASQDARLSKFEADFKQQQSEMTNKINTGLKAITDRMAGPLPSHTVKNLKLNINTTSSVLSIRSYPTIDPQCSSHPSTSINVVKTCSKEASHSHIRLLQTGMGIGTEQTEEPESTLEDEFQDLHLNLPVLEVLAHTLIYNAMLDKYVDRLELGKNRSAFVQGEVSAKMEDPRLFTLPLIDCRKAKIAIGEGITRSVLGVKGVDLGKEEAPYWTTVGKRESYKPRSRSDGIGAQTPYYARKDFLDCHLPGEWEIARDIEINPFKDVLVFRRMVEFLGALPINLKRNM
ncbi:hypothetical protein Tco_0364673 [Tanacetum coccineum]